MPIAPNQTTKVLESKLGIRFLARVRVADNGCWIWVGGKKGPYGVLPINGKRTYAHRISWKIYKGAIPDGMLVCHNCPGGDNPVCVNPNHLFLGDDAANNADKEAKGRGNHLSGAEHYLTKRCNLLDYQEQVRQAYASGLSQDKIAEQTGLSQSSVSRIIRGRR
jgi:hypothetical protein